MYKLGILCLIMGALILFSCTNHQSGIQAHIKELEEEIGQKIFTPELDKDKIYLIRELYTEYVKRYPKDTLSPIYSFRLAQSFAHSKDYSKAIEQLDEIQSKYAKTKVAPKALFFKAFLYWEKVNKKKLAAETFALFLKLHPDHHLASDAKTSISLIKNDSNMEEIIREKETS